MECSCFSVCGPTTQELTGHAGPHMSLNLTRLICLLVPILFVGCNSGLPIRFHFEVPEPETRIYIDEGRKFEGEPGTVFSLSSSDMGKQLRIEWGEHVMYGRMDVHEHTNLTRVAIVPIRIGPDILRAMQDSKAVTYVLFERPRRHTRSTGSDSGYQYRVHRHGDTTTRQELIDLAAAQGPIITVIDFSPRPFKD
jgi:hypothetical protein